MAQTVHLHQVSMGLLLGPLTCCQLTASARGSRSLKVSAKRAGKHASAGPPACQHVQCPEAAQTEGALCAVGPCLRARMAASSRWQSFITHSRRAS